MKRRNKKCRAEIIIINGIFTDKQTKTKRHSSHLSARPPLDSRLTCLAYIIFTNSAGKYPSLAPILPYHHAPVVLSITSTLVPLVSARTLAAASSAVGTYVSTTSAVGTEGRTDTGGGGGALTAAGAAATAADAGGGGGEAAPVGEGSGRVLTPMSEGRGGARGDAADAAADAGGGLLTAGVDGARPNAGGDAAPEAAPALTGGAGGLEAPEIIRAKEQNKQSCDNISKIYQETKVKIKNRDSSIISIIST